MSDKEKKSKKKLAKQKKNNRKTKDNKGRDEKTSILEQEKCGDGNEDESEEPEAAPEKTDIPEDVSDISDSVEVNHPDFEERGASPINWDTTETSCSGLTSLSAGRSFSVVDDTSSTCSTELVPAGGSSTNHKKQKSPTRGVNERSKSTSNWGGEARSKSLDALPDTRQPPSNTTASRSEPEVVKKEVIASQQRKPTEADSKRPSLEKPRAASPPRSPPKSEVSAIQSKLEPKALVTSDIKRSTSDSPKLSHKSTTVSNSVETSVLLKADPPRAVEKPSVIVPGPGPTTTEKPKLQQVPAQSRPLSAPVVPGPRPAAPVVSMVPPTSPLQPRSVSAANQSGADPSPATHSYVPQSYRNAIVGNPTGFSQPYSPSSVVSTSQSYPQSPSLISGQLYIPQGSERIESSHIRPSYQYGMMNHDNGLQWDSAQRDSRKSSISQDHPAVNEYRNFELFRPVNSRAHEFQAGTSGRQAQGTVADEFPHLDIINDLLNDEHGIGMSSMGFHIYSNRSHHLNRHFSFPGDIGMSADLGPTSSCRFERTRSYHDEIQQNLSLGAFDNARDMIRQPNQQLISGQQQMDGLVPNQWQMMVGSDPAYLGMSSAEYDASYAYHHHMADYSNMACGVSGYGVYRPPNGL